ncbi:uncharacterized protein LOC126839589 [Adelges cooleyi]|uniref:uncharacterized protein LOC126839589 n=1 Tax=Adelges cooleyi TaxID=133065 RepID=UPI00217F9E82|nr:uncharacterized protein LOC126839589 [Adelges cooleyi]
MDNRRHAVNLILEQVAEEVTNLLDWFTNMVIQMIGLRGNSISLKRLLDLIKLKVVSLDSCLEHLYYNRANVTQALDRYLFLSDIVFVYQAEYEEHNDTDIDTPKLDFEKQKILDLIEKKTNMIPIDDKDAPQKSYTDMLGEAQTKIIRFTKFYNRRYGFGWLNTDKLKWKGLMKSATVQQMVSPVSGKSLQLRYDETAAEVDSTKVIAFYAEVAETITVLIAKRSFDILPLFVDFLLAMINGGSSNDPSRRERLEVVIKVLSAQLDVLKFFEGIIMYKLHLECPAELLLAAIENLDCVINRIRVVLVKDKVLDQDIHTFTMHINPVNASDPAEKQPDIAVTEIPTAEKLVKDMKAIVLETRGIGTVLVPSN